MGRKKPGRGSSDRRKRKRSSRENRTTGVVQGMLRDPGAAADMLIEDVRAGADPAMVYGLLDAAEQILSIRGVNRARQLEAVRSRIERYVETGRV